MKQLPLGVRWPDHSTFANFLAGPNSLVAEELLALGSRNQAAVIWIWGQPASGKTHLLQAVCGEAGSMGRRAAYFPLAEREQLTPAVLAGCEQLDVVCIDDAGCRRIGVEVVARPRDPVERLDGQHREPIPKPFEGNEWKLGLDGRGRQEGDECEGADGNERCRLPQRA